MFPTDCQIEEHSHATGILNMGMNQRIRSLHGEYQEDQMQDLSVTKVHGERDNHDRISERSHPQNQCSAGQSQSKLACTDKRDIIRSTYEIYRIADLQTRF